VERSDEGGEAPCFAHLLDVTSHLAEPRTLARLLDHLADAVVICDGQGIIVFWNAAAASLFGWPSDDATGRPLDIIIPERFRDRHWDGYRRALATGRTDYGGKTLEVPALHRDGHTISIAFTVTFVAGPDGGPPCGIAAVIRDDTAAWQLRRDLQRQSAVDARAKKPG
jgi:PAS domain S-box-containing protein